MRGFGTDEHASLQRVTWAVLAQIVRDRISYLNGQRQKIPANHLGLQGDLTRSAGFFYWPQPDNHQVKPLSVAGYEKAVNEKSARSRGAAGPKCGCRAAQEDDDSGEVGPVSPGGEPAQDMGRSAARQGGHGKALAWRRLRGQGTPEKARVVLH